MKKIQYLAAVFCCAFGLFSLASSAEAITLEITNATTVPGDTATNITLEWSPRTIHFPAGTSGGISYPALDVSPSAVYLLQWVPGASDPQLIQIANNPPLTITRDIPGTWQFQIQYDGVHPIAGGSWRYWSNIVSYDLKPAQPIFNPMDTVQAYTPFTLSWSEHPADVIYRVQEYTAGGLIVQEYWPSDPWEVIPGRPAGERFFRVCSYNALPQDGGIRSEFSDNLYVTIENPVSSAPTLFGPNRPALDTGFHLQWTSDAADYIYQLQESFSGEFPGGPEYWPTGHAEFIRSVFQSTQHYRVRAWSALPENGGQASEWSNIITVDILDDDAFLELVSKATFDYFVAATTSNGLTLDRLSTLGEEYDVASTAASGYYLSALTVAAERGWISAAEAESRALTTLQTFDTSVAQNNGFYYHFVNLDGSPSEIPFLEISSIDTALFIAGALQAGEYFGGPIKALADQLYDRIDWTWMYDPYSKFMKQAWTPQAGVFGDYGSFSEAMLLYLLAIGSSTHPIPAEAFYSTARPKGSYNGPDFIFTEGGQLFVYQYPLIWYDLRETEDALGVNYWNNAREAVLANRRYCMDHSWLGYSEHIWGLTASDGPYRSPENIFGYQAYGAKPSYFNASDGTIAPTGIGGSVALAPVVALSALKHLYTLEGDALWTQYGFVDAFNKNLGWVDDWYITIDQGTILLMIENLRSGMIWDTFMQNPAVIASLERTGFSGYAKSNTVIDPFEDQNFGNGDFELAWWDNGSGVYQWFSASDPVFEGAFSMGLTAIKGNDAWAHFNGHLSPVNPHRDFSGYNRIGLQVYGDEAILVKLRDRAGNEQDVAARRGREANAWNHLVFDFTSTAVDLTDIRDILFFVAPGETGVSETLYIDNVSLEVNDPIYLETFEDGDLWSPDTSLGWWDIDGTAVYQHWIAKDPSRGGFGAMQTSFNKNGMPWSLFGGYISPSNPAKDFSQRTRLTFWAHGAGELLVKLRDRNYNEADVGTVAFHNSVGWVKLSLDYSQLEGVDLTDIDNVLFFASPGDAYASGWFVIDDIAIE